MFFRLEMRNGYLHVFYDFGFSSGPVHLEDTLKKAQINDAKYHEVQIIVVWLVLVLFFMLRSVDLIRRTNETGRIVNILRAFVSKEQLKDPHLLNPRKTFALKQWMYLSYRCSD